LAELKKAMAKPGAPELKGVTEEELERLLKLADFDGDGALSNPYSSFLLSSLRPIHGMIWWYYYL
jgi:hypothetical protein